MGATETQAGQHDLTGEVVLLDPALIDPSPFQRRRFTPSEQDRIQELAENMLHVGQLEPIKVRRKGERYELLFGERRTRACRYLERSVAAIVVDASDMDAAKAYLVENYHRNQLRPIEEAESFATLLDGVDGQKLNYEELAHLLSVSAKYVQRRVQLLRLSKQWQSWAANPDHPVYQWPVQNLEFIAKFPQSYQKTIGAGLGLDKKIKNAHDMAEVATISLHELRERAGREMRLLTSAPWKLDDESICPKAGACSVCPKRSGEAPELFDPEDFDPNYEAKKKAPAIDDRCLDPDCWQTKLDTFVKSKIDEVKAKHGEVTVLVQSWEGYKYWERKHKVTYASNLYRCKKSDKGAKPCVLVEGKSAGSLSWRRSYQDHYTRSGTQSTASGTRADGKPKPKPLRERRKAYELRRARMVLGRCEQAWDEILDKSIGVGTPETAYREHFPHLDDADIIKLAAVFGTMRSETSAREDDEVRARWADPQFVSELQIAQIFADVSDVLLTRIRYAKGLKNECPKREAEFACNILGLDFDAEWHKAEAEIPYPKSWEKLNEDGTPKKAAKKKAAKKKAAKKKAKA